LNNLISLTEIALLQIYWSKINYTTQRILHTTPNTHISFSDTPVIAEIGYQNTQHTIIPQENDCVSVNCCSFV